MKNQLESVSVSFWWNKKTKQTKKTEEKKNSAIISVDRQGTVAPVK